MDIDIIRKNNLKQYLFADKNENENLSRIGSNLTSVYAVNNKSGIPEPIEIKQLFTSSKNELKNVLSGLIELNIEAAKDELQHLVNSSMDEKIQTVLSNLTILQYKGDVMHLPSECDVGEIFSMSSNNKKEYYICIEKNKLQRIILETDINYYNDNYYKKEEFNNLLSSLSIEIDEKINQLQNLVVDSITRNEFNELNQYYSNKIKQLSGLISGFFI